MEQLRRQNAQAKSLNIILGAEKSPLDLDTNSKEQRKNKKNDEQKETN